MSKHLTKLLFLFLVTVATSASANYKFAAYTSGTPSDLKNGCDSSVVVGDPNDFAFACFKSVSYNNGGCESTWVLDGPGQLSGGIMGPTYTRNSSSPDPYNPGSCITSTSTTTGSGGAYFSITTDPITACYDGSAAVNGVCSTDYRMVPQSRRDPSYCGPCDGNPVYDASGEKVQAEQDIAPSPNGVLAFTRYYSSQTHVGDFRALGQGWRDNYSRTLDIINNATTLPSSSTYTTTADACTLGWGEVSASSYRGLASGATASYTNGLCVLTRNGSVVGKLAAVQGSARGPDTTGVVHTVTRSDGRAYVFEQNGSAWQERYGASVILTQVPDGWLFTDTNGTQEHYDNIGRLTTITDRAGHTQTLSYNSIGLLASVSDVYGRKLIFTYDYYARIAYLKDPNGGLYRYTYDNNSRLVSVRYPDSTTRKYLYEDSRFPNYLTGIIDEKGQRFASWSYDDQGRVSSSEHAGGAERVDFTYNPDGSTTVHDAGGGVKTYHFSLVNGSLKVTNVTRQ